MCSLIRLLEKVDEAVKQLIGNLVANGVVLHRCVLFGKELGGEHIAALLDHSFVQFMSVVGFVFCATHVCLCVLTDDVGCFPCDVDVIVHRCVLSYGCTVDVM